MAILERSKFKTPQGQGIKLGKWMAINIKMHISFIQWINVGRRSFLQGRALESQNEGGNRFAGWWKMLAMRQHWGDKKNKADQTGWPQKGSFFYLLFVIQLSQQFKP